MNISNTDCTSIFEPNLALIEVCTPSILIGKFLLLPLNKLSILSSTWKSPTDHPEKRSANT